MAAVFSAVAFLDGVFFDADVSGTDFLAPLPREVATVTGRDDGTEFDDDVLTLDPLVLADADPIRCPFHAAEPQVSAACRLTDFEPRPPGKNPVA